MALKPYAVLVCPEGQTQIWRTVVYVDATSDVVREALYEALFHYRIGAPPSTQMELPF